MTLWELVERRARATPAATLLRDTHDRRLTCLDLRDAAEQMAAGLYELGIGPGTPVTWVVPNRIETVVASVALARLGAIQNPVLHVYRHKEIGHAVRETAAEVVLIGDTWNGVDYRRMLTELVDPLDRKPTIVGLFDAMPKGDPARLPPPPDDAEEVRWIYFTSGTTNDPKGVLHTDSSLIAGARGHAKRLGLGPADVATMAAAFSHIAGPIYLIGMLLAGYSSVIVERFVASEAVPALARYGVTMLGGGIAFYQLLLGEQRKFPGKRLIPSLRALSGGGAPMAPDQYFELLAEVGVRTYYGYGMTECPMICQGSPDDGDEELANTVGTPIPGLELCIVREDGTDAAPSEHGEIHVKGPMVCRGYTDESATTAAFDDAGWFRTGDLGLLRPDGRVVITGRLKDVIIRKGENISAQEIENILRRHPKVADVAVIGLPDPERGERVCAVVEPAPGVVDLAFDEMVATLNEARLMKQKIPEQLEIVHELPRNHLGKALKAQLRASYVSKPSP